MSKHSLYLVLAALLLPECCLSMTNDAPLAQGTLPGRFFIAGRDLAAAPATDIGMVQSLYELPASGGSLVLRLPQYRRVFDLAWYASTNQIGISNREGALRGLFLVETSGQKEDIYPTLSPALSLIYSKLITATPPSKEQPLRVFPTQVVLSPDGKQVAGLNGDNQLCVAERDNARVDRCATEANACEGSTPAWSPDGRKIAFAAALPADNGACNLYELFVMDVGSGTAKELTNIPGPRYIPGLYGSIVKSGETLDRWHKTNRPRWSPDGQWIAFTTYAGVGRIHPDGTGMSILAKGAGAVWSPDGTMIAYRVPRKVQPKGIVYPHYNVSWTLYVSRADGTGAIEIPVDPTGKISVEDVVWTN